MSAVAGIFSRDGGQADAALLRRLSLELRQLGPDGENLELAGPVGMLLRPFVTDEASRRAAAPWHDARGTLLAFDGWLDNRQELAATLRQDLPRANPTVPEIVVAAFRRWGLAGFGHLVGSFSLALWNLERRELHLATDALGFRPLYFSLDANRLVWASRARPLAQLQGCTERYDLDYFAAFLANNVTATTPYQGIRVVPGGHVLTVDATSERLERYWDFDPEHEIRYANDGEYEEQFRHLFSQAVACRLPEGGPVFTELSGGVDSSSIVCVADRLLKHDTAQRSLHTVSYVFDGARSADERPYIREVERFSKAHNHHLREEDFSILGKRPPAGFCPDLPGSQLCYLARYDRVAQLMEETGGRVLLNGIGGDQAFISDDYKIPLELADLRVRNRPLSEVLRASYRWSRALHSPLFKTLWTGAIRPLTPLGRRNQVLAPPEGEWLRQDFVRQHGLAQRHPVADGGPEFRLPSRGRHYWRLRDSMRLFAFERHLSQGHFEVRYPYLDRRLLEFALAIPLEQKLRPNASRSIVRRALEGWMPQTVLQRRTKAGPTEAFQRALVRERHWISELFADPLLGQLGLLEPERFRQALHRARHGMVQLRSEMHRTIALELWLRCSAGQDFSSTSLEQVDPRVGSRRSSEPETSVVPNAWAATEDPKTPLQDGPM